MVLNLSVVGLWEKAQTPINIGFCNSRESNIQDQPLTPLQISPRNAVIAVVSGFFEVDFAENFNNFNFRLGIEQKKRPQKMEPGKDLFTLANVGFLRQSAAI